ncbi:cell surface glycoprotein CD200 receptor 1 isoform X1 [Erinaceus europaeus]|uniref:Cell surface glycoprotein CD200 receptor 1 isoform X1 n=1 Tax=Erinaceus europaeus TaxID=9365 RepID=A0ABM3XZV4_ERIEU|nr:cell surface glycoprotein CD200 receptor 1 isoform X1 [Erinaceus europaeus]
MPCHWRTSDLQLLLTMTVFLVLECVSAGMENPVSTSNSLTQQMNRQHHSSDSIASSSVNTQGSSQTPPAEATTSLLAHLDTKVVLSCPRVTLTNLVVATWEITIRDKLPCTLAYRKDKNETNKSNCTDERITWAYRPDENPALLIHPVTDAYEGRYICNLVTAEGNFQHTYHLQVLVPPEVTLYLLENRTAVCQAVSRKPAAQISWTPERDCTTEPVNRDNHTVTVQSKCYWAESNASTVICSVSHWTGNKSLFIELGQGNKTDFIKISILSISAVLLVAGSIYLLKICVCRKCKRKKLEVDFEQDEMQPYASYTEKNNPLYDTANRVKIS